jgi:hypothetical protein
MAVLQKALMASVAKISLRRLWSELYEGLFAALAGFLFLGARQRLRRVLINRD